MKNLFGIYKLNTDNTQFYNMYYQDILKQVPDIENYTYIKTYRDIKIFYNMEHLQQRIIRLSEASEDFSNFSLIFLILKIIDYLYDPKYSQMITWTNKYVNEWWYFTFNCYHSHVKFSADLRKSIPKQLYIKTYLGKKQLARDNDTCLPLPF